MWNKTEPYRFPTPYIKMHSRMGEMVQPLGIQTQNLISFQLYTVRIPSFQSTQHLSTSQPEPFHSSGKWAASLLLRSPFQALEVYRPLLSGKPVISSLSAFKLPNISISSLLLLFSPQISLSLRVYLFYSFTIILVLWRK